VIVVRLADGPSEREGRLEVYFNNEWGTVCHDDFTDAAARVVCYMLGYGYVVNNRHLHSAATVILPQFPASYIPRVSKSRPLITITAATMY